MCQCIALTPQVVHAQSADEPPRRQQERERALRDRQETRPDARLSQPVVLPDRIPRDETPCFPIHAIRLDEPKGTQAIDRELCIGADVGHVCGPSTQLQPGDRLAGAVVGLRGGKGRANRDVFVGAPIKKPEGFPTACTTAGFGLGWSF